MSAWKSFGAGVFVSVSIATSIGYIWPRPLPVVSGRDVAQRLAALNERLYLAESTGTNAVIWPSNTVSIAPSWSQIYTRILCPARALLVTNALASPCVLWLDPTFASPADGDYLATPGASWYVSSISTNSIASTNYADQVVYFHKLTAATNAADCYPVASTRWTNSSCSFMPFLPDGFNYSSRFYSPFGTTNFPFSKLFYGTAAHSLSANWPGGSVWPRIGLGTNVYSFNFERFVPDTLVFPVSQLGSGFSCTDSYAYVSTSTPSQIKVTSQSGLPSNVGVDRLAASSFKMINASLGLSTVWSVGTDGFAGSWAEYWWSCPLNSLGAPVNAISFAPSVTYIDTTISIPHGAARSVTASVTCTGDVSVNTNSLSWASGNPLLRISCPEGGYGLVTLVTSIEPWYGYLTTTDVGIANPSDTSTLTIIPSTAQIAVYGTHDFTPAFASSSSNSITLTTGQALSTQCLAQADAVLARMTRTMYIAPYGVCAYTSCLKRASYTESSFSTNATSQVGPSLAGFEASNWGLIGSSSVVTSSVSWDSTLASVETIAERQDAATTGDYYGAEDWRINLSADASIESYIVSGCVLPYPSHYACASGYVSKVQIFGIFQTPYVHNRHNEEFVIGQSNWDTISYDSDAWTPTFLDAVNLGVCSYVCPVPASDTPVFSLSYLDVYSLNYPADLVNPIRLSKIGEWTSPATQPTFSLGSSFTLSESPASYGFHQRGYKGDSSVGEVLEIWNRFMDRKIQLTHFVVVVDWAFKYPLQ